MIRLLKKIPIANENGIANGRHVPLDRALSLRFSSIWGYVGHSSATCEAVMILRERGEDKGRSVYCSFAFVAEIHSWHSKKTTEV